ncbi:MAG: hypothetical protein MMC33_010322 [Icmadophila ericetorum]|nr:hypothetical protein [Icmadophila ericetorum]
MRPDKGEDFDEWVRHNDIVRKWIPAVGGNRDLEQRQASWLISQGQKAKRLDSGPAAKKPGVVKEKAKRRQLKNRPEVGEDSNTPLAQQPDNLASDTDDRDNPGPTFKTPLTRRGAGKGSRQAGEKRARMAR